MSTWLIVAISVMATLAFEVIGSLVFAVYIFPRIYPRLIHKYALRAARRKIADNAAYGKRASDSELEAQMFDRWENQ